MIIQHNISALNAQRQLGINNSSSASNLEKLSSGYKINRAADDAAGLAISEKMRGQIRGLAMAESNAQNGISLIKTAEGGLNETHAILQRMRELAVQSANGTYDDEVDRLNINKEVSALKLEIDRIAASTNYNGISLLDGSLGGEVMKTKSAALEGVGIKSAATFVMTGTKVASGTTVNLVVRHSGTAKGIALQVGTETITGKTSDGNTYTFSTTDGAIFTLAQAAGVFKSDSTVGGVITGMKVNAGGDTLNYSDLMVAKAASELSFQIGANGTADQQVGLKVFNMSTAYIGDRESGNYINDVTVTVQDDANAAIGVIDKAINQVSTQRAGLGALQNRLEHTINNLGVTQENLQAAESTVRDVDMAKEMMEFTKNNILSQAAQAMLAQANQLPQGVLQLLR
ncbi:flagellin [Oscillospiraceae bacterium MB08-C2-2]|nr:flagellin [Oscillospiraceae bacterium MB08-C2-2]